MFRHATRRVLFGALALSLSLGAGAGAARAAETVLFIGNSFTYGALSPVWKYRADSVTDLNGGGVGGVPALFKLFAKEAGLDYTVSLETVGGKGLDFHLKEKARLLDKAWDHVVMHGLSTLDFDRPGDPAVLIDSAGQMARLLHGRNPKVDILLTATWSRADQTYLDAGHWHGQPIQAMGNDVRKAYDAAAKASPFVRGVVPVGDAWNRAIAVGFADPNPYDGIAAGQVNLWAWDSYHASAFGYYLEALMVFGRLTGKDPQSLGDKEQAAQELGLSPKQAAALQQIAHDELAAYRGR
jgi:putative endopeptidase